MKVSIITACYNAENSIEDTLRSIEKQTYDNIELIVIDGASSDKTLDILHKYNHIITKLISEPDDGVYNAMNKGIKTVTGDLIFFLNADDVFINEFVIEQFANFAKHKQEGLILGDIVLLDKYNGKVFHKKQLIIDDIQLLKSTVFHPATFFRKEVFKNYGLYNEQNKIASDYEWYLNYFVKNNGDYTYFNKPITIFSMSGISSDEKQKTIHEEERKNIQQKYFTSVEINTFNFLNKYFSRKINKISFRNKLTKLKINRIY